MKEKAPKSETTENISPVSDHAEQEPTHHRDTLENMARRARIVLQAMAELEESQIITNEVLRKEFTI